MNRRGQVPEEAAEDFGLVVVINSKGKRVLKATSERFGFPKIC